MKRRILVLDRSELAKNVYAMIASKLCGIETVSVNSNLPLFEEVTNKGRICDLIIAGSSIIESNRKNFLEALKSLRRKQMTPCLIMTNAGGEGRWSDFLKLPAVGIVEKPFFPDAFLERIRFFWSLYGEERPRSAPLSPKTDEDQSRF